MTLQALKDHLITAVSTAALLGGATTLVSTNITSARHDERIKRVEEAVEAIPAMQKDLRETREGIIRMEAKMEATGVPRRK